MSVPPYATPTPPPGYPAQPTAAARPKTLAIIALVAGAVGLVLAFIPFVTFASGIVLLAAFVLGLIALIKKQGGTGLSIAAIVLAIVGWIVSVFVSIASIGIIGLTALDEAGVVISDEDVTEDPDILDAVGDVADETVTVTETAFGKYADSADVWWFVVLLNNPNADYIFEFSEVEIEALAADGTVLDTATEYRTFLSGAAAVGGAFSIEDGEIDSLSVKLPDADEATYAPFTETGALIVDEIATADNDGMTEVAGNLRGDFGEDQAGLSVTVVARAADGTLLGSEWTLVDLLPADGTAVPFEVLFAEDLPEGVTFEAYPSL